MGPKRRQVRMFAIWRYFIYSVLVGRCCRSPNSPLLLMIQGLFKSIITIVLFKGPKETSSDVTAWPENCRPAQAGLVRPSSMKPLQGFLWPTAQALHFWSPKLRPRLQLGWLKVFQVSCLLITVQYKYICSYWLYTTQYGWPPFTSEESQRQTHQ